MTPKSSIITVTRNRPYYLAEAILSVEAQTDPDWEHLVFDNGSEDSQVLEVLHAAKFRHPDRFFYFAAPHGVDRPAPYWNLLLQVARGKYVTVLDDDNRKMPKFLEIMTEPMERDSGVDAVTCGWSFMDADGKPSGKPDCHSNRKTCLSALWRDNTVDSSALLFRKNVLDRIGAFPMYLTTNEDWHFLIRLAQYCSMIHLKDVLLEYREHAEQRSHEAISLGAHENWKRIRQELFPEGQP